MKIICSKELLINNINLVSKAVSSRTTLPILECILLNVDENGFKMIANDLEMGIETKSIDCEIKQLGSIALEAKIFSDIIKKLPSEEVIIESDNKEKVIIKSGKAEFKIIGQDGEDFPLLPLVEKNELYKISSNEFRNMIKQTIFSVSTIESKPVLTGELIEIEDGRFNLVAVDSFRVSLRVSNNIETKNANVNVVVPSKSLNELSKILFTDEDIMLNIYFTNKHILFEMDNCTIVSRLLEGEFLKYKQVFTEDYTTIISSNRQDILSGLERASLISHDNKKAPVKLKIENNKLIITTDTDMGNSYDEIDIDMDGSTLEISFNPKYLIDAIKVIDTEKITMQFTTSLSPCIIKGFETDIYKYLILPLRLG